MLAILYLCCYTVLELDCFVRCTFFEVYRFTSREYVRNICMRMSHFTTESCDAVARTRDRRHMRKRCKKAVKEGANQTTRKPNLQIRIGQPRKLEAMLPSHAV